MTQETIYPAKRGPEKLSHLATLVPNPSANSAEVEGVIVTSTRASDLPIYVRRNKAGVVKEIRIKRIS